MSTDQKVVKVPQNLFTMLYSTITDGTSAYTRVSVTPKKGAKSFNGIRANNGLETFLIIPQKNKGIK